MSNQRLSKEFLSGLLALGFTASLGVALPQGGTWEQESYLPSLIYGHQAAYDSLHDRVLLFGGGRSNGYNSDFLEWTSTRRTWEVIPPGSTTLPNLLQPVMAADDSGNLWLFGGVNGSGLHGDTWHWDGTAWNGPLFTTGDPSDRSGSAMVYDSDRGIFVLFGGATPQYDNETWTLDPATGWTLADDGTGTAPSLRYGHAMVYDDRQKVVLLFGGSDDPYQASNAFGDTWSYDGNVWTQLSSTGPAPRMQVEIAFDPTTGTAHLYGGTPTSGGTRFTDHWTWDWNSTAWEQVTPDPSMSGRGLAEMVYDESGGELIVCGGETVQGTISDETWRCLLDPSDVTFYCKGLPNSVGSGARIGYTGTTSIAANDFTLTVSSAPTQQFGLFYHGPTQIEVPFGEGLRCVGGGPFRFNVVKTDLDGNASYWVDLTVHSFPPGSQENFQFWYRDPSGGPNGFNFSDALEATFKP
jgi:hypothetical protein